MCGEPDGRRPAEPSPPARGGVVCHSRRGRRWGDENTVWDARRAVDGRWISEPTAREKKETGGTERGEQRKREGVQEDERNQGRADEMAWQLTAK